MIFREDAHDAVWWDKDNRENIVVPSTAKKKTPRMSIGREKEDPIRRQRRLDSICGMSAVPVVNKVIGAKRKTIVGVDGRDREITEEESKSPWFTNKNPTRYGNAKDVARALVINQSKKEGAEEAREKRTEEDR